MKKIIPFLCAFIFIFTNFITAYAAVTEYKGFNVSDFLYEYYDDIPDYTLPDVVNDYKYYVLVRSNRTGNFCLFMSNLMPIEFYVSDDNFPSLGNSTGSYDSMKLTVYKSADGFDYYQFSGEGVSKKVHGTYFEDGFKYFESNYVVKTADGDDFFYIRGYTVRTVEHLPAAIADKMKQIVLIAVGCLALVIGSTVLLPRLKIFLVRF